VVEFIYT
jgi:transglutaminase-like putative cysteine protease